MSPSAFWSQLKFKTDSRGETTCVLHSQLHFLLPPPVSKGQAPGGPGLPSLVASALPRPLPTLFTKWHSSAVLSTKMSFIRNYAFQRLARARTSLFCY